MDKETMLRTEYGWFNPALSYRQTDQISCDEGFCAGKAIRYDCRILTEGKAGSFDFPYILVVPKQERKAQIVVTPCFSADVPNKYLPIEEITDEGFGVAAFDYQSITSDSNDFTTGVSSLFHWDDSRPGKIAMWAWACSKVLDSLWENEVVDHDQIAVAGHSRLGKTAILAGAIDSRFSFVFSNDSGCGGAAMFKGKTGEKIADITNTFPYWFSLPWQEFSGKEESLPFDQDEILSLMADRNLYVASARDDAWADPDAEYRSIMKVSPQFNKHGGHVGYHLRNGSHYFSREDWVLFLHFFRSHLK